MTDLVQYRRYFAEEIEAVARLRTPGLADALATVERERYLPPGPWTVLAETDLTPGAGPRTRTTPDADPRRVYHNVAIAIDASRQLFNGQPATLAAWIDALDLSPGARVLHVGAGLGYYTAVLAAVVGPRGRVTAFEVDERLAEQARANVADMAWVSLRQGDATTIDGETYDAVLVNAGVTHPLDAWLDALADGGRMLVPLTATMPAMGSTLGKGLAWRLAKDAAGFEARLIAMVAIYSAVGVRDEAVNAALGKAMMGGPPRWLAVKRLRRDPHDPGESCWLHAPNCCLSTLDAVAP